MHSEALQFVPASPQAPQPASRLLAQRLLRLLVDKTAAYFSEHDASLLQQVRDHLLVLSDTRQSLERTQHLRSAAVLLDRQAAAMQTGLRAALSQALTQAIQQAFPLLGLASTKPAPSASDDGLDGLTLSLIDVDEVNRLLLLDRISQPFNLRHEAALNDLSRRLAGLTGQARLPLADQPFRPAVFIGAFMTAWEKGAFDAECHEDLMGALEVDHFLDLAPLYVQLNAILEQAGVQFQAGAPRIRKAANSGSAPLSADPRKPEGTTTAHDTLRQSLPEAAGRSSWGGLMPMGHSIAEHARSFLQRLGWQQSAHTESEAPSAPRARAPASAPAEFDPGLMSYLSQIQARQQAAADSMPAFDDAAPQAHTNVLRQLREQDEMRHAPDLDRGTLDVLAEVFDFVFADQAIPKQMKYVIGRLQIPVLKAAMMDRDFFLSWEHPARKLVDTLAAASVAWVPEKGEADPLYVRIETTVQRVLNEFGDDLSIFGDLLAEFMEFLFESEQQAQAHIEPVVQQEQDLEALAQAQAHADELIHERLQALAQPFALFLTPFLTEQWREVIARAALHESKAPGAWNAALHTMDQLIWSVQPKMQAEDRQKLVAALPTLVRELNAGLDELSWDGEPRSKFTKRLIATHMQAIRVKAPNAAEAPDDSRGMALEQDASDKALQALDERRSSKLAAHDDLHDQTAQELKRGLWFEVQPEKQAAYRCRLSWISPMRTRFLFTNRDGHEAFVRTEREVAAMLRLGTLQMLEQTPIVGRALERLMTESVAA
jgi:hypothetical protein